MEISQSPESVFEDENAARGSWRGDRVLLALLLIVALLGLVYNFIILPGFGPDEPRHFAYVKLLFEEQRFPFLMSDGKEYHGAHSLHPPLYYFCLLPFYALSHVLSETAVYHFLRSVSLLFCLASLPLWYEIACAADGRRSVARLTVAITGLLPIFGMTAGVVNNDSASIFFVALFIWLLTVRFRGEYSRRVALWLGLCLGLGMLCKATVLLCDVGALLVYFLAQQKARAAIATWFNISLCGALGALIAAPWYVRNFVLYGKFSPIESGYTNPALPSPSAGILVMMMHDHFPPLFAMANWGLFYSLWSQKDWFPENLRTPIYALLAVLCVAAFGGHILVKRRQRAQAKNIGKETACEYSQVMATQHAARRAIYAAFSVNFLACLAMALFVHWGWAEGGRYLVAALGSVAFFLARGWCNLFDNASTRAVQNDGNDAIGMRLLVTWCALAAALNAVAIYWLLAYLNPTFGPK
jgi:4-amino-4-deoxy-L-arabinose transferase-like glycosyltransferase